MNINNLHKLLLVTILVVVSSVTKAEYYFSRKYKNIQTAPATNIQTITQDRSGFIWVGTEDNLYRFDGQQFIAADSEFKLLDIATIYCSKNNQIWINANGKLYIYDCNSGIFRKDFPDERFVDLNWFHPFDEDINGDMWLCQGADSVRKYSFATDKIEAVSRNGLVSICGENVFIYHPDNGEIVKIHTPTGKSKIYTYSVVTELRNMQSLNAVSESQLILSSPEKCIYILNLTSGEIKKRLNSYSSCFAKINNSKYFIGGEAGIFVFDIDQNEIVDHIKHDRYNPNSIACTSTSSIFCDAEGGVWTGSWTSGLGYSPKQQIVFETHYANSPKFRGKIINGICEDDFDHIWVASQDGGVNRITKSSGEITNFSIDKYFKNVTITDVKTLGVFVDELWAGTYDGGIIVMDAKNGRVKRVETPLVKSKFKPKYIRDFNQTRDGSVYVSTRHGVLKYNKERTQYTDFYPEQLDSGCVKIYEDLKRRIWALTEYYVYCIETDDEIRRVAISNHESATDLKMFMEDIVEDCTGRIWLATTNGLATYDEMKNSFTIQKFGTDSYRNSVFRIELDDLGRLWCSTKRGIVSFSKPDFSDKVIYGNDEGLPETQFNYHSSCKERESGRIWFGSTNGVVSFMPQSIEQNEHPFKIQFINISYLESIDGITQMVNYDVLSPNEKLTLTQSNHYVNFKFITPSYKSTDINYFYRLEKQGSSDDREYWIDLNKSNQISFQKLPAGNYTLRIKSVLPINHQESQASFDFTITPPFYASIYAYAIYVIILTVSLICLLKFYTRRDRLKRIELDKILEEERQKELFNAKINFFTYITHEIRTPLSLIKIPLENIINNLSSKNESIEKELRLIEKNTNNLTNLCSELLDFRKMEGNGLQLSYIKLDVATLLNDIVYMFTPSVESKKIKLELKAPTSEMFVVLDKWAFSRIANNLIDNAIKYGIEYVSIEMISDETYFYLIISNDGKLIDKDEQSKIFTMYYRGNSTEAGAGIGLPLCRQLAEMHGGLLMLEVDQRESLNKFILKLPVEQRNSFSSVIELEKADYEQNETIEQITSNDNLPVIFVIEDNRELRACLKQHLSKYYKVIVSKCASDAIQKLGKHDVSLIVSDLMMPGMSGIELCKRIKADVATSHIPFVLLSANTTLEAKLEGMNCGADDYIDKPFSISYLHARIDNILHQRETLYSEFTKKPLVKFTISANSSKEEQQFISRITDIVDREYGNCQLDISMIADELKMSKATLYRKIKSSLNITLVEFITIYRLQRAAELLKQTDLRINEIAFMVGFSSATYFTTSFQRQFGMSPSEFIKQSSANS